MRLALSALLIAASFTAGSRMPKHEVKGDEWKCWTELKVNTGYPPERICGPIHLMPADSVDVSDMP